jgi:Lipoate-protein ligase A
MLRYIFDSARSAAMNMALDETLFDSLKNEPVLRVYFWDKPYTTIGYFQKNDNNAVRRLTGGLLVNHNSDLSYGFCASAENWAYLYSQQNTYKYIHSAIKKALLTIDIKCDFAEIGQEGEKNMFCVQTLYSDDLMLDGKKIAGSCMRRRGKKILVQGSLHLDLKNTEKEIFSQAFAANMAELLKSTLNNADFCETEIEKARVISNEKYLNAQWNNKF